MLQIQFFSGLFRVLKEANHAETNILTNPEFMQFRGTLDACMKQSKSTWKYQPRRAGVISESH